MSIQTKSPPITVGQALFALVLLLGIVVRLHDLGAVPLSETEAEIALQARAFSGENAPGGAHPLYAAVTGLLFFLFGESNFAARLFPALAGSLVVLVPWLLRGRLGALPAFLAAVGLAFDPLLVGTSRIVGSPMPAITLLLLALALRIAHHAAEPSGRGQVLFGVAAGLALLTGPSVWLGLLILGFSWLAVRAVHLELDDGDGPGPGPFVTRPGLVAFALTIIFAATLFLRFPQGIAAIAGSIPAFLLGWGATDTTPVFRIFIGAAAYLGLNAVFAIVHMLRESGRWKAQTWLAALLGFISLAMVILYPGREAADLAWVAVPLWVLTAAELAASFRRAGAGESLHRPLVLAAVLVVLVISFWNSVSSLVHFQPENREFWLQLAVMVGTLLLAALSIALVAMGWESGSAKSGTAWAGGVLLGLAMVSGLWSSTPAGREARSELWAPAPGPGRVDLLEDTLNELGTWAAGEPYAIDVVLAVDSDAATWALRDYPNVRTGSLPAADEFPGVILAAGVDQDLRIASTYRGQDLSWTRRVLWDQMGGLDWLAWILFREAPVVHDQVILWARADLFLASEELALDLFPLDSAEEENPVDEDFVPLEDVDELRPE